MLVGHYNGLSSYPRSHCVKLIFSTTVPYRWAYCIDTICSFLVVYKDKTNWSTFSLLFQRYIPEKTHQRYPNVKRGNFSSLTQHDLDFFRSVCSPSGVIDDVDELSGFNIDWMRTVRGINTQTISKTKWYFNFGCSSRRKQCRRFAKNHQRSCWGVEALQR